MPFGRLIDWAHLQEHYIDKGIPIEDPILDEPEFRLIYHPGPARLGVRLRIAEGRAISITGELQNVDLARVNLGGHHYVQVLTDAPRLFPAIYALINDVLRRVASGEPDCVAALLNSLRDFETLVARVSGISREEAIGIYGELLVLEALVTEGVARADAWIGADLQSHDFRFGGRELEVKTTTGNARHHHVHGLNQLVPTPGHTLDVVSVRLAGAGSSADGRSLDDLVDALMSKLADDQPASEHLKNQLRQTAYERGRQECTVRYRAAAAPMCIRIGEDFPVVGYPALQSALGVAAAGRVIRLDFVLNLEGLGIEFSPREMKNG